MRSVLFVCIENAARSQMAEGFARALANFPVRVASAGTRPANQVDPLAMKVMAEVGIDISQAQPKMLNPYDIMSFDYVITMGGGAEGICPTGFPGITADWQIADPKGCSIDEYSQIRDVIRNKVEDLLAQIADQGKHEKT